jgi:hypothetical protein
MFLKGLPNVPQRLTKFSFLSYDPSDTKTVRHELLNIELVDWNTHYSKAYRGRGAA